MSIIWALRLSHRKHIPRLTITTRPRYFGRMTDQKNNPQPPARGEKKTEQLSDALRANLAKRKQQARARKENTATDPVQEKD